MLNRGLAAAIVMFSAIPAAAGDLKPKDDLQAVTGTYRSAAPESWYGAYGVREFTFADGQWSLIFTHALDPAMTKRTFQFRTGGAFEILEASKDVEGAYHGVFHEEWKHVTLLTDDNEIVQSMGLAECNLTHNLEVDISESGCGHWQSVERCGEDHDLFAMDDQGVYFGVRPRDNDMCTADKLPTSLLPVVAKYGVE